MPGFSFLQQTSADWMLIYSKEYVQREGCCAGSKATTIVFGTAGGAHNAT